MEWVPDVFKTQSDHFDRSLVFENNQRIWVPENTLSLHSPKFSQLFKKNCGDVHIKDVKLVDMVELLECVVPCPNVKKIGEHNLDVVLRLATEFNIPYLRTECQNFVDDSIAADIQDKRGRFSEAGTGSKAVGNVGDAIASSMRTLSVSESIGSKETWTEQKSMMSALNAVRNCTNSNRTPSGPFAHLYEKPIPKYLTTPPPIPYQATGILTRPGPSPNVFPSQVYAWVPDSPRSPYQGAQRGLSTPGQSGLGLGPNGTPSKAMPLLLKHQFGSFGPGHGQFNSPHGFCLSASNDNIVVADTNNHRIQVFAKTGNFDFEFGIAGREEGNLWYPRKVAVNQARDDDFVICDRGSERSRMQIFDKHGRFVRKIPIRFVDIVAGLSINSAGLIIVVDSVSPTIFCINPDSGELHSWHDCSTFMKEPSDVACFNNEFYICDFKGHCVCVFDARTGGFIRRIGGDKITNFPNGIDISRDGDVMVGDSHGNRLHVSIFKWTGEFEAEFDCAHLKVSRASGLRLTSSGLLVTLAKNNHQVLVLDSLTLPDAGVLGETVGGELGLPESLFLTPRTRGPPIAFPFNTPPAS